MALIAVVAAIGRAGAAEPRGHFPDLMGNLQAPACPWVEGVASSNGTDYVVFFAAPKPMDAGFDMHFYGNGDDYAVTIPNVGMHVALGRGAVVSGSMRSAGIDLRKPAGAQPLGVLVITHADGLECPPLHVTVFGPDDETTPSMTVSENPVPIAMIAAPGRTYPCEHPFVDARVDGNPAQPVFPDTAKQEQLSGMVRVKVILVPQQPRTFAIYTSTDSTFDGVTLAAARATGRLRVSRGVSRDAFVIR